jgi:hypothetical protein
MNQIDLQAKKHGYLQNIVQKPYYSDYYAVPGTNLDVDPAPTIESQNLKKNNSINLKVGNIYTYCIIQFS